MTAHFHSHTAPTFSGLEDFEDGTMREAWHSRLLPVCSAQWIYELSKSRPAPRSAHFGWSGSGTHVQPSLA
ncbi:MAG: hypothetical protein VX733_01420 [Candidatus Latescibacterota bacterium]|nr:hypothetical protein [Candidatus Latescibacterota bacterium]